MPTDETQSAVSLEEELRLELRRARLDDIQADAVARRLGWDGQGGTTLEAAGELIGVTRERIRQLVSRVATHLERTHPTLPMLASAIDELEQLVPVRREAAADQLKRRGLSRVTFDPHGVLEAARLSGLTTNVGLVGPLLVGEGQLDLARELAARARKRVSQNGAGNLEALVDEFEPEGLDRDAVRRFLEVSDVVWLDDALNWFVLGTGENRAANHLRKMLSVSPTLTIAEVREGLRRPPKPRSVNLPLGVVRSLCAEIAWVDISDDIVQANVVLDFREVLENTEETLVDVFRDRGPVLDRATAVDLAQEYGLDRTTAALYLGWSPVIDRLTTNRYALRGADVPAGTLEAMRGSERRRRVQQGHGWTKAGRLWLGYTISQGLLDSKVVGVPSTLRSELHGRFSLEPAEEHLGKVASDGQNMWGLSRLLRRYGAEEGDALVLEFDLAARKCYARVGSPDLLIAENRETPESPGAAGTSDDLGPREAEGLLP